MSKKVGSSVSVGTVVFTFTETEDAGTSQQVSSMQVFLHPNKRPASHAWIPNPTTPAQVTQVVGNPNAYSIQPVTIPPATGYPRGYNQATVNAVMMDGSHVTAAENLSAGNEPQVFTHIMVMYSLADGFAVHFGVVQNPVASP